MEAASIARPGADAAEVESVVRRYGVELPVDFAGLCRVADGIDEGQWDDLLIRFSPIAELTPVLDLLAECDSVEHAPYFVFADYSLCAHGYAIRLDDSDQVGTIVMVCGKALTPVAACFSEFLLSYMQSSERLFPASQK